jgi:hypothetical protein
VFVLLEHFRILLANYIVILFYITSNKKMYHHAFPRIIFQCQGENSPVFHLQFPFVLLAATVTKKKTRQARYFCKHWNIFGSKKFRPVEL